MYKLGIDVGGTNTDAVLTDENRTTVADIKYPTSADIYDGILDALCTVMEVSGVDRTPRSIRPCSEPPSVPMPSWRESIWHPSASCGSAPPATIGIRPLVDWAEDIQKVAVGTTTILVSHSVSQVEEMCSKVLWLQKGRQIEFGNDVQGICQRYQEMLDGGGKFKNSTCAAWRNTLQATQMHV